MLCREWVQAQVEAATKCLATVFYASAYGNTAALAQAISRGITKAGQAIPGCRLHPKPALPASADIWLVSSHWCTHRFCASHTVSGFAVAQVWRSRQSIWRRSRLRRWATSSSAARALPLAAPRLAVTCPHRYGPGCPRFRCQWPAQRPCQCLECDISRAPACSSAAGSGCRRCAALVTPAAAAAALIHVSQVVSSGVGLLAILLY